MTSPLTKVDDLPPQPARGMLRGDERSRRFGVPLMIAIAVLLLLLTTMCVGWLVRNSMRETARQTLQSTLAADVAVLRQWLRERRMDVEQVVGEGELASLSRQLLIEFASKDKLDAQELAAAKAAQELSANIPGNLSQPGYVGWLLLDTRGRVIATSHAMLLTKTFALPGDSVDRFDAGQSLVLPPLRAPATLSESGPLSKNGCAVMLAIDPVSEGLGTLGGFALIVNPIDQFSNLLAASRMGHSGESYAFDRQGVLLSQSRFEQQLRDAGLLGTDPDETSLLNTKLIDPGTDVTMQKPDPTSSTLTHLADQATRGGTGCNVTGYQNYLGVNVIGAWQWLPECKMCVGTEMQYSEAFASLRILRNATAGGLATSLLLGLGAFALLKRRTASATPFGALTRRLGQYELGEIIGKGGMGSVYYGRHQLLQRDVAVKVLEHTDATTRSLSRFEREVQMTAKLRHPNTIEIYDYGRTGEGTFFYVMEYVDGISLQQLVDNYGRQPPERIIFLMLQVCGSISEAHQQSMVHRDIKPANILLAAQAGLFDLVKVLDFGLVKDIDRDTMELTITESMTGTPLYMSPEAIRDASKADQRSDLYSIGAVGYTLLTGLPPFDGPTAADICVKQLNEEPQRPSDRIGYDLADDLQNILMSCLRKDAEERPASAADLADALMQCKDFGHWTLADAHQWWEQVFESPRDDFGHLRDNQRPGPAIASPSSIRRTEKNRSEKPGHDTKVNDSGDRESGRVDKRSEETA